MQGIFVGQIDAVGNCLPEMSVEDSVVEIVRSKALSSCCTEIADAMERARPFIRKIPRIPSVISRRKKYSTFRVVAEDEYELLILLDEGCTMDDMSGVVEIDIELNYKYFSYSEVLERVLPENIQVPSSFEIVGSIVHLNLDEEQMKYKDIIGRVIHDKTGKTVITKVGQICNRYRFFDLEVIGGDGCLETVHREGDILFHIDYSRVYWCSKLQGERLGLVGKFKPGETICDLFCGVGPVSLPALHKGCIVYSNDLNPDAIRCLRKSIALNRLNADNIKIFNMCASRFLECIADVKVDHFFLNLPEHSLDYLGTISTWGCEFAVHCYFFCRSDRDVVGYIHERTGLRVDAGMVRMVRKVSPTKDMFVLETCGQELGRHTG